MSEKDNPAGMAEYYDTHNISADMEAGEWSRQEGKRPETTAAVPAPDGTDLTEQRAEELAAEIRARRDAR
jgi:hypothetical protein